MKALGQSSIASFLLVLMTVASYVIAFVLVIISMIAAATPFVDVTGWETDVPVALTIDPAAHQISAPSLGISAARLAKVQGSLVFSPPSRVSMIAPALFVFLMLVVALWVLHQLRAVFRTLRDGRPFVPANATRIRWIGWAVIVGELTRAAATYLTNTFTANHFSGEGLRFTARADVNVFAIVNGLIILVLAEVFREGTRLDEDHSLTV